MNVKISKVNFHCKLETIQMKQVCVNISKNRKKLDRHQVVHLWNYFPTGKVTCFMQLR